MKLFNVIAASVAVAMTAGVANADINSQLASLQAQVNQLQAQVNNAGGSSMAGVVGVNPNLSWAMMGNMPGVGKELTLLQARQNGLNNPVTIGGYAEGDILYQHANQQGNFNAAPIQNNAQIFGSNSGSAQSNSRLLLSNADLSTTATIGQWVTAYIQAGATNVGSGGADNLSIQDAYAVFGNLAKNPVYAFAGKKDVDFGSFATVDMYNAPLTRQYFQVTGANAAGFGLNSSGFNGTISLLNGGVNGTNANTPGAAFGKNYAVNLGYGMTTRGVTWNLGAGYLNGSQFLSNANASNGAWDVNGKLSVAGFDLLAEYDTTAKQANAVSGAAASRVDAWDVGADYNFAIKGLKSAVSADYSQASLASGSNNTLQQVVLGFRVQPINNVWTGLEYSYNKNGFYTASNTLFGNGYSSNQILWDVSAAF